jgi:hypothetical protein
MQIQASLIQQAKIRAFVGKPQSRYTRRRARLSEQAKISLSQIDIKLDTHIRTGGLIYRKELDILFLEKQIHTRILNLSREEENALFHLIEAYRTVVVELARAISSASQRLISSLLEDKKLSLISIALYIFPKDLLQKIQDPPSFLETTLPLLGEYVVVLSEQTKQREANDSNSLLF